LSSHPERFDPTVNPVGWHEADLSGGRFKVNGQANNGQTTGQTNGHSNGHGDPSDRLVFGYYMTDGYVEPTPAVKRAMKMAIDAVQSAGHEVVEWEPYQHDVLDGILDRVFTSDGGKFVAESRKDEPLFPYMRAYGKSTEIGAGELWELNHKRAAVEREYFRRWNESGRLTKSGRRVDALICPVAPVSGHPPHHATYVGYTSVWNAVDYPAIAIPVTTADKTIDGKPDHEPLSKKDRKVWADYNPEVYHGGRVGLQVVCRRYEDEKVIAVARLVSEALKAASPA
jgi:amidase